MSEIERAVEVVEIKIGELKLKPGSHIAMVCPETWTPRQIAMFQAYMSAVFKQKGYEFDLICFPECEIFTVSPEGGFK